MGLLCLAVRVWCSLIRGWFLLSVLAAVLCCWSPVGLNLQTPTITLLCQAWECFGDSSGDQCSCSGQAGAAVWTPSVCPLIGFLWSSVGLVRVQEMPEVSVADWVHQLIETCLCVYKQVLLMPWVSCWTDSKVLYLWWWPFETNSRVWERISVFSQFMLN